MRTRGYNDDGPPRDTPGWPLKLWQKLQAPPLRRLRGWLRWRRHEQPSAEWRCTPGGRWRALTPQELADLRHPGDDDRPRAGWLPHRPGWTTTTNRRRETTPWP